MFKKVNNSDNVISIDLHNGYSIVAISGWNPKINGFITSLYLKENTIETMKLIEDADRIEIHADHKTIYPAILKKVSTYFQDGFFDYYINRDKFENLCLDKAYEIVENGKSIDNKCSSSFWNVEFQEES